MYDGDDDSHCHCYQYYSTTIIDAVAILFAYIKKISYTFSISYCEQMKAIHLQASLKYLSIQHNTTQHRINWPYWRLH